MKKIVMLVVATLAVLALVTTGAVAGSLVTSKQIKDGTIKERDLRPGLVTKINTDEVGTDTDTDTDTIRSGVYRVENYLNGGGGSATVACADTEEKSKKYTAIAGGVQGSESGVSETQSGFLVSSSFPGRMDWSTGQPKPGRLDGWIVFGNSQYTDTLKVWALCVPTNAITVQQVDLDN